ncbi:nucleotidyltransferase domain-containing protein [Peribacillus psychrosaccharolyticus]|uniref:Nucleotidyltransferase domain-containing protein n=1 Tax=Peribacillus psychrosaccharolyticus TaxID=1407 RepID=A0A974NJN3_PERPY|nr:nucleotidyltransferase domain-containing protein [Peribacillus psychrosaccharolyticus]MEC2055207.1 nucleotidyltransferase domain-containing protein [Peribacillus psychrosaccharolyticus]MED3745197.1 nucleotidyltransferase domain-containing protein [Peribacillus psychrosaccharolyticus]QQS98919.1 nucleotidyltransferase domain-containing protein [Peribacillus psychrosaccharolyticus]
MIDKISAELKRIEEHFQVKILYACESGSRAFGFPSPDSDYDVRFIYLHTKDWYLSIDQYRNVIERPICEQLDMNGWELTKALQLYRKSNPSLLEWLYSEIVYVQPYSVIDNMRGLFDAVYSTDTCLLHYLNMAKANYRTLLKKAQVSTKIYLTILRPILACKWMIVHPGFPPVDFSRLAGAVLPDGLLKNEVNTLVMNKRSGNIPSAKIDVQIIHHFIEKELIALSTYTATAAAYKKDSTELLNNLFRDALNEVWCRP